VLDTLERKAIPTELLVESPLTWSIDFSDHQSRDVFRSIQTTNLTNEVWFPRWKDRVPGHYWFQGENWGGGWIFTFFKEFILKRSYSNIQFKSVDPRLPLPLFGSPSKPIQDLGFRTLWNLFELAENTTEKRLALLPVSESSRLIENQQTILVEMRNLDAKMRIDAQKLREAFGTFNFEEIVQDEEFFTKVVDPVKIPASIQQTVKDTIRPTRHPRSWLFSSSIDREILWEVANTDPRKLSIVLTGGQHTFLLAQFLGKLGYSFIYYWVGAKVHEAVNESNHLQMNTHLLELLEFLPLSSFGNSSHLKPRL